MPSPSIVTATTVYVSRFWIAMCNVIGRLWSIIAGGKVYTLPTRTVRVISQIGEGGYSFVYLVKDTRSGERFALKVIRITESEQLKAANNEISIHRMLNDKHVMPLLDTATQTGNRAGVKEVLLLFPFISRGNLAKERTEMLKTGKCYPEDTVLQIFLGICKGLDQFHSNDPPFCHNDLKMENVMLSEQGEPILTDFGSASAAVYSISNRKEALEVQEWAEANCTMTYRAPELFNVSSQSEFTAKADIWGLGCLLYAIAYGSSPFEKAFYESGGSVAMSVVSGKYTIPDNNSTNYSNFVNDLITSMLQKKPSARPSVTDIVESITEHIIMSQPVQFDDRSFSETSSDHSMDSLV